MKYRRSSRSLSLMNENLHTIRTLLAAAAEPSSALLPRTHDRCCCCYCLTMVFIILWITETTFSHFILRCGSALLPPLSTTRRCRFSSNEINKMMWGVSWCENLAWGVLSSVVCELAVCDESEISAKWKVFNQVEGGNELTSEKIKNEVAKNLQRNEADLFNKQSHSLLVCWKRDESRQRRARSKNKSYLQIFFAFVTVSDFFLSPRSSFHVSCAKKKKRKSRGEKENSVWTPTWRASDDD